MSRLRTSQARPAAWSLLALSAALVAFGGGAVEAAPGRITSPMGVQVDVPDGFQAAEPKPGSTTAIALAAPSDAGGAGGPEILVNCMRMGASFDEAALFAQTREMLPSKDTQLVELSSGQFLRVDFDVTLKDGAQLRHRCYAGLRNGHAYYFFLTRVSPEAFPVWTPGFDAMVAGARFFEPGSEGPAQPEPSGPAPSADSAPGGAASGDAVPAGRPPEAATPKPAPARPQGAQSSVPATPEGGERGASDVASAPAERAPAARTPADSRGPAAPAPAGASLLGADSLALFDSEYDPDIWAAAHLVDGDPARGWSAAPGRPFPHRFVFALPAAQRIAAVSFGADCPEEQGFEGVEAKGFKVEVSTLGPERGFAPAVEGALEAGRNDQVFRLGAPTEARWVRLTLASNHGHNSLTSLMEFRVHGVDPAPGTAAPTGGSGSGFHLDQLRASREKNGAEDGQGFRAGERVWVNFKPRALTTNAEGKVWLEVDLVLEDAGGNLLLRRERVVDQVSRPPAPPLSSYVSLFLDLPEGFPAGSYTVRLVARDRFGEGGASGELSFPVVDQ